MTLSNAVEYRWAVVVRDDRGGVPDTYVIRDGKGAVREIGRWGSYWAGAVGPGQRVGLEVWRDLWNGSTLLRRDSVEAYRGTGFPERFGGTRFRVPQRFHRRLAVAIERYGDSYLASTP